MSAEARPSLRLDPDDENVALRVLELLRGQLGEGERIDLVTGTYSNHLELIGYADDGYSVTRLVGRYEVVNAPDLARLLIDVGKALVKELRSGEGRIAAARRAAEAANEARLIAQATEREQTERAVAAETRAEVAEDHLVAARYGARKRAITQALAALRSGRS